MAHAKFDSHALLAIEPRALGLAFMIPASRGNQRVGDNEVVSIEGPITSNDEQLFDSYESIRDRVKQACLSDATTVVLKISSPGGEVHNCYQTSRDIRQMCAAAGKALVSYIDGQGCSAAYALACAAPTIVAAETSTVGSIGVITERQDISEMLAQQGIKISYITSGSKKAFGSEATPLESAELMDSQRTINNLAAMFFTLVEQHRGIPAGQVALLEAGTFIGQEAVNARLIDRVGTLEALLLQSINASPVEDGDQQTSEDTVTQAQLMEALKALIESGDAEDIAAARALIEAATTPAPTAAEDAPPEDAPPEEEPEEEPAAEVEASVETAAALAMKLETTLAENQALKAQLDADSKAKFFAEHQVSDTLRAVLESKPLAEIEAIVAAMVVRPEPKKGLGTVKTTQGLKQYSASAEDKSLDRAFGLNKPEGPAVSVRGPVQTFRLVGR